MRLLKMINKLKIKVFQMIADGMIKQLSVTTTAEYFNRVYQKALLFDDYVKKHHNVYLQ